MLNLGVEDYLARCPKAGESSKHTYRKILTKCESWIGRPLKDAREKDLLDLKARFNRENFKSGHGYMAELRRFYKADERPDLAAVCTMKLKRTRLLPQDILTLPEVQRIIDAAPDLRYKALFSVLWATGERVSAVSHLRIRDIHPLSEKAPVLGFSLEFRKVKIQGQEHEGWIFDGEGAEFLREWIRVFPGERSEDAPLFPSATIGRGQPLTESAVIKVLKHAAKRAGITKRVYPHLFRHSRATYLMRHHVAESDIEKLLGWAPGSGMLARRYGHLSTKDAYNSLLQMHGVPEEKLDEEEKIVIPEEAELRSIVPLMSALKEPKAETVTPQEVQKILGDSRVLMWLAKPENQEMLQVLGALRSPPPA